MDLQKLREQEDEALVMTEGWSRSKQLLIYSLLNRRWGCTMDHIDDDRLAAFVKEEKAGS